VRGCRRIRRLGRGPLSSGFRLDRDNQAALAECQGLVHSFRQARPDLGLALEPVDHDLDEMLDALVQLEVVGQAHEPAIHAGADETPPEHVLKKVFILTLLPAHHRGKHQEACAFGQGQDAGDNLFARLGGDGPPTLGAMALADAGVEDTEIIVDLGDRADGRARVPPGGLLLNADGGREAGQQIHVRFF
jgi:hypothetical protein